MFKKIFVGILVLLGMGILTYNYQNNPQVILSKINVSSLDAQPKQLYYKLYLFGIFHVGKAILEDRGIEKQDKLTFYHLAANAQTDGLINQIYPLTFTIDSFLDQKTFLPFLYKQSLKTKEKELLKEVHYDQVKNIMLIANQRRSILPETYEPLSAVYKLRHTDLNTTAVFDLNINTNQKNYALTGKVLKSSIKHKEGLVNIFKLSAKIFRRDKNPYHQSAVDIIFLDNAQKTPLFIKVFASGLLKTVRLTDAK